MEPTTSTPSDNTSSTKNKVIPFTPTNPGLDTSKLVKQTEATTPDVDAGSTKILVVEDEPDARTMFVDLLEMEGYDVSGATDGVDAIAKAGGTKYALILLDIVMPNKDGIEVLQELKSKPEKYGNPVIVMLTNISGDAAVEKAMEMGASGYRLKINTEPDQLLKDIKDFLSGKVQDIKSEPVDQPLSTLARAA